MRRTHRNILLAFLLLCGTAALPAGAPAQQTEGAQMKVLPQGELDVIKVLLAQERAWNKGNLDDFASGYKNSPDTIFMGNEVSRGYDTMLQRYKKNYPDRATMGKLTFSDLEPHLLSDHFATVTGKFALERAKKNGGNASGMFSLVMELTDAGWKIVLDHTT